MRKRVTKPKIFAKPEDMKYYSLLRLADGFSKFISVVPKYTFWVFFAYQLRYAIKELAGKETLALIQTVVSYNTGCGLRLWFCFVCLVLCTSGIGYGLYQRKMRSKQIQMDTKHIQQLERVIDKKKSSSNLTSKGKTNPTDE